MLIKMAFRNLLRNTRKTLAIGLTLIFGCGALFIYHGFNTGIMNQYRDNTIHARYGHGQINTYGYRDQVFEKPWDHWIDNFEEIESWLKSTNEVAYVFPRLSFFALLTNGEINVAGRGEGVEAKFESEFFNRMNIIDGDYLKAEADGALLGSGLARSLGVKVGDRVTVLANTVFGSLNGMDFRVVGIFNTGVKEFDDSLFRIQLSEAKRLLDTEKVESIAIGLKDDYGWTKTFGSFEKQFPKHQAIPFEILDKHMYQNAVNFLQAQFETIRLIILVIVIMGIFNTVSTAILERKHEIGTLRANGDSATSVMVLLLSEGVILGVLGSVLGLILSYALCTIFLSKGILMPASPGITRQFRVIIELQLSYGLITVMLGVCSACLGVLLSGLKVARTPISELLRAN